MRPPEACEATWRTRRERYGPTGASGPYTRPPATEQLRQAVIALAAERGIPIGEVEIRFPGGVVHRATIGKGDGKARAVLTVGIAG